MSSVIDLEQVVTLDCRGSKITAVIHGVKNPKPPVVLLNIVGGPQYRVGSHRQFVLTARHLAQAQIPCIRFDYRGMGDSEGELRSFEDIDDDLCVLTKWIRLSFPNSRMLLMGMCDGASAAAMACIECEADGLVIVNPWVHSESFYAKATVKHYYAQRLFSAEFRQKLLSGHLKLFSTGLEFFKHALKMKNTDDAAGGYLERMRRNLERFDGPVLTIMSGQDLTAREFDELIKIDANWKDLSQRATWNRLDFPSADHTFSDRTLLDRMNESLVEYLNREFAE